MVACIKTIFSKLCMKTMSLKYENEEIYIHYGNCHGKYEICIGIKSFYEVRRTYRKKYLYIQT